jgi:hypothetical protein
MMGLEPLLRHTVHTRTNIKRNTRQSEEIKRGIVVLQHLGSEFLELPERVMIRR